MAFFDIFGRNLIIFDPHKSIYNFTTHGSGEFYRDPISHIYHFKNIILSIPFKSSLLISIFKLYLYFIETVTGEIYRDPIYQQK
jgi:hypothetical protein